MLYRVCLAKRTATHTGLHERARDAMFSGGVNAIKRGVDSDIFENGRFNGFIFFF